MKVNEGNNKKNGQTRRGYHAKLTNRKNRKLFGIIRMGGSKTRRRTQKQFTRMNCSPAVLGKTATQTSCFTNKALITIRDAYNAKHLDSRIMTDVPAEIWGELKTKLSSCSKEDCWLNEITDVGVRNKLDKYLFAPDKPNEWKNDPNAWLSNFDIFEVLDQYEKTYDNFKVIGPTPIDFDTKPPSMNGECVWKDLCTFSLEKYVKNGKTKLGIVFNLDKHDKGGSHWVSMFVDFKDQFIFFLDSAGEKIPKEVDALVQRIVEQGLSQSPPLHMHFYENCPLEHQYTNTECGMYSLYFIITMLTNKAENKRFSNFMDKIRFFKDKRIPDRYINKFRNVYFNSK
jgi:hypothetical protein